MSNFFSGPFFGGGFFGAGEVVNRGGGPDRKRKRKVMRYSDLEARKHLEYVPPPQVVIVAVEDESEDELVIALLARVLH